MRAVVQENQNERLKQFISPSVESHGDQPWGIIRPRLKQKMQKNPSESYHAAGVRGYKVSQIAE